MSTVTVSGSNSQVFQLNYSSNDATAYAQGLADSIDAQIAAGALAVSNYAGGNVAPGPSGAAGGVVVFSTSATTPGAVLVPNGNAAVVDNAAGPVSVWGGSTLKTVVAGSGGLSFYAATAPTSLLSIAAGDGANWIATATVGGGNYNINLGAGNDTVRIDTGNATVNMGTGQNTAQLGNGNSTIISVGADLINGNSVAGGGLKAPLIFKPHRTSH